MACNSLEEEQLGERGGPGVWNLRKVTKRQAIMACVFRSTSCFLTLLPSFSLLLLSLSIPFYSFLSPLSMFLSFFAFLAPIGRSHHHPHPDYHTRTAVKLGHVARPYSFPAQCTLIVVSRTRHSFPLSRAVTISYSLLYFLSLSK